MKNFRSFSQRDAVSVENLARFVSANRRAGSQIIIASNLTFLNHKPPPVSVLFIVQKNHDAMINTSMNFSSTTYDERIAEMHENCKERRRDLIFHFTVHL